MGTRTQKPLEVSQSVGGYSRAHHHRPDRKSTPGDVPFRSDPLLWCTERALEDVAQQAPAFLPLSEDVRVRRLEVPLLARLVISTRKQHDKWYHCRSSDRVHLAKGVYFSPSGLARRLAKSKAFVVRNYGVDIKRPMTVRTEAWFLQSLFHTRVLPMLRRWVRAAVDPTGEIFGKDHNTYKFSVSDRPSNAEHWVLEKIKDFNSQRGRTGRVPSWVQRLTKEDRKFVFEGFYEFDMTKAHPTVIVSDDPDAVPDLAELVDEPERYSRHAMAAKVPISMVKLYVNMRCIGSPPTASPKRAFVKAAFDMKLPYERAVAGLKVLDRRLKPVNDQVDAWLVRRFGRNRGRKLVRDASTYMMWRESELIFWVQKQLEERGIKSFNLHDGGLMPPIAGVEAIFEAAPHAVDLPASRLRVKRI